MNEKFDFNDILIEPATISTISSRTVIHPYHNGFLPLITAPMDTVVDLSNKDKFLGLKINVCLPRGENFISTNHTTFESLSLDHFNIRYIFNDRRIPIVEYVLIDIANGHMSTLMKSLVEAKRIHGNSLIIMAGNVANPKTYTELSNAGADYVRVGIGNGGACTSTVHTGVGYPMASLINECNLESLSLDKPAKIVADGGMQNYSDVIKALALGADYVMIGSLFNKAIESCGDNYLFGKFKVGQSLAEFAYEHKIPVHKKFRGMSTKEVQKKWGKEVLTTSEGVIRFRKVEYKLNTWVENLEAYLRSAMSYSNALTLDDFIGKANTIKITTNAYTRFKK